MAELKSEIQAEDITEFARSISECRSCQAPSDCLVPALDLGMSPLANRLRNAEELAIPELRFPLKLVVCPCCGLLQITHTVDPKILYQEYLYYSSVSEALLEHSRKHVEELIDRRGLTRSHRVVEAASNDGYLLQYFIQAEVPCLGVEPARKIAASAVARGVPTRNEFFTRNLAQALVHEGLEADVFIAKNVLAHACDTNDFVSAISVILKRNGIAEIEVPYVRDMIEKCEFDTIYHEHLCYFSCYAIEKLLEKHNLVLIDVKRLVIHGGSLRLTVARNDAVDPSLMECSQSVKDLREEEANWRVKDPATYLDFSRRVQRLKQELKALLWELKNQGKSIAAYGASAKGTTLLNSFGIGRETLEYVVDRASSKQGLYTPGTKLQIHGPEVLSVHPPDYLLLLTWNFADEILDQQRDYRCKGGKFIVPIPTVQII